MSKAANGLGSSPASQSVRSVTLEDPTAAMEEADAPGGPHFPTLYEDDLDSRNLDARRRDEETWDLTSAPVRRLEIDKSRQILAVFRRNPHQDGRRERIRYEGYQILWPDGEPMSVGLQRFCQVGSRLLGLGRRMSEGDEQLVKLVIHPVASLEAPLTRPGPRIRCRRFYLERQARRGRVFFFNGSPTDVEFDTEQDDPRVLHWLGLPFLKDGEQLWFDLSAQSLPGA